MEGLTMKTQQQLIYNQEDYELDNQYNDDNRYQRENSSMVHLKLGKEKKYRVSKVWHGFFIFSSQLFFYYFFFHYLCPVKWAKILTLDKKKKNFFCFVLSKSYLCTYE